MKEPRLTRPILTFTLLLIALLACNIPGIAPTENIEATETMGALETIVAETMIADEASQREESPTDTLVPSEPTRPAIVHEMRPGDPVALLSELTDLTSQPLADEHRAIGDSFTLNLYERPFTAGTMDYLPHLDIVYAELGLSAPWIYVVIHLEEAPPHDATATYGVEIDLDLDGRGDWLIMAASPPSSEWTTEGVRAMRDTNDDVGGPTPLRPDAPDQERDGYDERVFDHGLGPDPDAAWVRRDPEHVNRIQMAIKFELIDSDGEFLWGAWSDANVKKPIWFDYHDHFTIDQAGDPAIISDDYPLKALAWMDNTCRWAFGFTPVGHEPGLCGSTSLPTPEPNMGYLVCTRDFPPECTCQPTCEPGDFPCTPCELP
ncbi:MAG: hypothetical protein JSV37_02330 [Anaerolineaceae bacterium]|nr:MAG: hypothetical protein JSV37_02330 [Anaerolineaceae bacterium]